MKPRVFYALYIGPNDRGTGHSVFKLSIKTMIIKPRCKPTPMPDDVIQLINQMGIDDGSPEEGIVFRYTHHALTVEDLYHNIDPDDNSNNASDTSWDDKKHGDIQNDDKNILDHDDVEGDEVEDLMEDTLQLRSRFGENINNANDELQYL